MHTEKIVLQQPQRVGVVLLLSVNGGGWIMSLSYSDEAAPHGLGGVCTEICLCWNLHFDLFSDLVPWPTLMSELPDNGWEPS